MGQNLVNYRWHLCAKVAGAKPMADDMPNGRAILGSGVMGSTLASRRHLYQPDRRPARPGRLLVEDRYPIVPDTKPRRNSVKFSRLHGRGTEDFTKLTEEFLTRLDMAKE